MLRASSTDTWQDDDGQNTFVYAHTYFPGVSGTEQAQTVSVAVGREVGNLNFAMRPGRSAAVVGVMQNGNGDPLPEQTVSLDRVTRGAGGAVASLGLGGNARTDKNGAFEIRNLPPGEYVVYSGTDAARVTQAVFVNDGDIESVTLAIRPPPLLSGTIVSDDGAALPFSASQLRVVPISLDADSVFPPSTGPRETAVARDGSFRFSGLSGQHVFRVTGLPDDWALTAVLLNDRNFIDTPIDFQPGTSETKGLRLVVSKAGGTIAGNVVSRDAKPAPDATVMVFAHEPGRWTVASRYIKAVRPDIKGRFSVAGLPAGIYRVAVRDFVADGQWEDPEYLTSLMGNSQRVEVIEGESQLVTLTLEPAQ
jgi:hypothetical protein